jgi:hypothetical protein
MFLDFHTPMLFGNDTQKLGPMALRDFTAKIQQIIVPTSRRDLIICQNSGSSNHFKNSGTNLMATMHAMSALIGF